MNTKSSILLIASIMTVFGVIMMPGDVSAQSNQNNVTVTPINEEISLQSTTTTMTIPEDNVLAMG